MPTKSTPLERFRLGHDDGHGSMYFEVRIFADEPSMHAHYNRSSESQPSSACPGSRPSSRDAAALCAPRSVLNIDRDGSERWHPRIGLLLFPREHLSTRVVSHELVHAALTYYRERRHRGGQPDAANFGAQGTWREEALAHIYCSLMAKMSIALHDRGYWTP